MVQLIRHDLTNTTKNITYHKTDRATTSRTEKISVYELIVIKIFYWCNKTTGGTQVELLLSMAHNSLTTLHRIGCG